MMTTETQHMQSPRQKWLHVAVTAGGGEGGFAVARELETPASSRRIEHQEEE